MKHQFAFFPRNEHRISGGRQRQPDRGDRPPPRPQVERQGRGFDIHDSAGRNKLFPVAEQVDGFHRTGTPHGERKRILFAGRPVDVNLAVFGVEPTGGQPGIKIHGSRRVRIRQLPDQFVVGEK
ncbi:hypothetical protein SDC9_130758 [bioreactor metagenome]|uniref:Uncharacterized protein n=1 Tax=bioreactor metagenome TaxID=1076179 RepID=A0A645D3B7_9ZZZZ